ncbi:MAG: hypothetical protein IJ120_00415 [Solobacterium sp.]|nr:hypothetical protein [Solobacterium sp.]
MTREIFIVLCAFLLFVVLILSGKVQIHVAALAIPIILEITGVLTFAEAWGGLTNSSVVMMASMFVVGTAVGKTSLLSKMSKTLIKPGSSDFKIMLGLCVPALFLGCFTNATASMTIMVPLITAVCAEHKRPLSKFMLPVAAFCQTWVGFLPTGGNAAGYITSNTIIENLGGTGTFTYFTSMISRIPVQLILLPLICWLCVKLAPDLGNIPSAEDREEANNQAAANAKKYASKLSPSQEKLTLVIFGLTVLGIVVCALNHINTWYPSVVGAMLLVLCGVLSDKEAIAAMGSPVIFITVGTLPLATALKTTGADVLLAEGFNKMTGNMPPIMIMICMYLICMIMTQFVSRMAVSSAFRTLAALIAVQNGYDPRALMLAVTEGANNAYCTPMAEPAITIGSEKGGYSMWEHFKMTLPLMIVDTLIFIIYIPLVFPLK